MKSLRVGIIGSGGRGTKRARELAAYEGCSGVAMCTRPESAERAREKLEGVVSDFHTAGWASFVKRTDLDVIMVATPSALHYEQALAALQAGKHVLVEYPLADGLEHYDRLVKEAADRGRVLHHALTPSVEPPCLTVKGQLPRIGRLVFVRVRYYGRHWDGWYTDPALCGDMFATLHIHFLEFFRVWLGRMLWVTATQTMRRCEGDRIRAGSLLAGYEDNVTAYVEFGMGFRVLAGYDVDFVGERGCIDFPSKEKGRKAITVRVAGAEPEEIDMVPGGAEETAGFCDMILGRARPYITLAESREAVRLALLASRAAEEGRRLDALEASR